VFSAAIVLAVSMLYLFRVEVPEPGFFASL
jgi:hypothetical protein